MHQETNILVITEDSSISEQLQPILKNYQTVQYTTANEVKVEIDRLSPDVMLLHQSQDEAPVDLVHYIQSEAPGTSIVYLSEKEDFELLRDIVRAGALEFFVLPGELNVLAERIDKISLMALEQKHDETAATSQNFRRGRGQVYSFYSGKGGSGRTFLASSFAQTMKLESTAQIVLIDLNLQFGGADTFLGIESNRSLVELRAVINELNENHIRNVVEKEKHSGLELLLSPKDAESAEDITEDYVSKLIRACRRIYDFVIIDLPSAVTETAYIALEESDRIYYVLNADTASLQVFKHVETLFQRLGIATEDRLEVVVNQSSKENELKTADLKEFVRYPVETEIRSDFKNVQAFMNQGAPIRKERDEKKLSPVAKDIKKWVLSKL